MSNQGFETTILESVSDDNGYNVDTGWRKCGKLSIKQANA